MLLTALAALPAASGGGGYQPLLAGCAVAATVIMAAAVLGPSEGAVLAAVGLVLLSDVLGLVLRGAALDQWAPLAGAALLVAAEVAHWSIELAPPAPLPEAAVAARRLGAIGAAALLGMVAGTAAVGAGALAIRGGTLLTAAGVVAVMGVLGTVAWLARRPDGSAAPPES